MAHPHKAPIYRLDVRAMLAGLGGREAVHGTLQRAEVDSITRRGLDKWHQRDSLPIDQLATLMGAYVLAGRPIDLHRYVRGPGAENELGLGALILGLD